MRQLLPNTYIRNYFESLKIFILYLIKTYIIFSKLSNLHFHSRIFSFLRNTVFIIKCQIKRKTKITNKFMRVLKYSRTFILCIDSKHEDVKNYISLIYRFIFIIPNIIFFLSIKIIIFSP